ncbi:hypothetical protein JOB18_037334 [Solea senegalensis]|uniref:Uncharacterized protein n=1 Tax=Solea senegalensis TaxID=28829 RepID=A0AAV6SMQ0_SOLSE|nr:hypothetical protein JOB18_037334 [Solea senegalensis]
MVDENSPMKKPEVILFYNQTKGGVDTMDQMVGSYLQTTDAEVAHGALVQHD